MGIAALWWAGVSVSGGILGPLISFCIGNFITLQKSSLVGGRPVRRALVGFTILSLIIAMSYFIILNISLALAQKKKTDWPEDEFNEVTTTKLATLIPFCLAGFLSGTFAIWRCRVIWDDNRGIRISALVFYIIAVIGGVATVICGIVTSHPEDWPHFLVYIFLWIYIYSFVLFYLILTISILVKTIRIRKHAPPEVRGKMSIFALIIESFVVVTILLLVFGLCSILYQRVLAILVPALVMLQLLNSALIISRVAAGTSFGPALFTAASSTPFNGSAITLNDRDAQPDASSMKKGNHSFEI